jgi:hypothetical protein
VEYVHADVFAWEPVERFDAALTGFFVSHIPPDRFARSGSGSPRGCSRVAGSS